MKYKTGYFKRSLLSDVIQRCKIKGVPFDKYYVIEADNEKAYNIIKKLWDGTFKAFISQIRILWKHKQFMKIISICANNGALERIFNKRILQKEVIERIFDRFKSKNETLRYILKWKFLPLDWDINRSGEIVERVASQAFDELDELLADEFFNKCYVFLADLFNVSVNNIKKWDNIES
jgi:hypothetical protein